MAAAIRGAVESETFDLAGQTPPTITNTIQDAFQEPLPLDDMIRITFITGAGKLGRQKYDDGAAKAVTSALISCGFVEDRGASAVRECAGSFKMQHDTGKNLKTVVVFPQIRDSNLSEDAKEGDAVKVSSFSGSYLLPPGSPEEIIALSPIKVFDDLVNKRCPSWSQKKGCDAAIADIQKVVLDIEHRLLQGTQLSDQEQDLYDAVSLESLETKHNKVRDLMHEQVEKGNITDREKQQLLSQVVERLEIVTEELASAEADNKPKKADKLRQNEAKLKARKDMLSKISPLAPEPLKHQNEIVELRKELVPLLRLEEGTKGRLLSVKETQHLARKDEILEDIAQLEKDSRGWFEDDDSFATRVEISRKASKSSDGKPRASPKTKATGATTMKPKSATNAWVSTSAPRARTSKPVAASKSKPNASNVGGVFAAMMLDDSDSD
jgi:hypothetical protein